MAHVAQHALHGQRICTCAAGTTRSAGFVRDFISVVPFFACRHPHAHMRAKEPPPSAHAFNTSRDIAGRPPMLDTLFANYYAIVGAVLLACLGAYLSWRVGHKGRAAVAASALRSAMDPKAFTGLHGHHLHGALIRAFSSHCAAAHEYRRYLSPMGRWRFHQAWRQYHGGSEEHPAFVAYYVSDEGPQLLVRRLERLREVA